MDTIKISDRKNCKIIAHRGQSSLEKENTIPAFVAAGNRSYFGIETDVHRTDDGKFIIVHDDTTRRVAPGIDVSVDETSYDELRKIQVSKKYGLSNRIDLHFPNLEEYLSICKHYEKVAVLELKNPMPHKAMSDIIEEIKRVDYLDNLIFISFDMDNLLYVRSQLPDQKIQFLCGKPLTDEQIETMKANKLDADLSYKTITCKEDVDALHNLGFEVNVWTVDDAAIAQDLIDWGVDYITTNALE